MSAISSLSANSSYMGTSRLFSKMDADQSGGISKEEFVSARPSDVTETMAENLFNKLDSSGSGSLSESDLAQMENGRGKQGMGGVSLDGNTLQALIQSTGNATGQGNFDDMIAAMDTDGNGTITQSEFVSARPSDVSEDMANNLWSQFDTEDTGSLSTDDLKTAMAASGPPPGPPPGGPGGPGGMSGSDDSESSDPLAELLEELTSTDSTSTASDTSDTSSDAALQAFLEAIKSYDASQGYASTREVMSTLLMAA